MSLFHSAISLESLKRRRAAADAIMAKFIHSSSKHEITLQGKTRARIKERLQNSVVEQDLFAEALQETDAALAALLPSFLRSDIYLLVSSPELFEPCKFLWEQRSQRFSVEMRDDDEVGVADGAGARGSCSICGCGGRNNDTPEDDYEVELGPEKAPVRLRRRDLQLLWRYRVLGASTRARKAGEQGFRSLARYSVASEPLIRPADPTQLPTAL